MTPRLLVGCPILLRAWAVPAYMDAVHVACDRAGVEPCFVFVGDPTRDPETWNALYGNTPFQVRPVLVEEPDRTEDKRDWTQPGRFERMAYLRNALLEEVRLVNPTWFLSLDSDIVLHPDAVVNLLETSDRFDAVGGKLYMNGRDRYPSYGMLEYPFGGLHRPDSDGVLKVDVVMACVLMNPSAFGVAYFDHPQGEDVGWSIAARKLGLTLGWDGRCVNQHRFSAEMEPA